MENEIDNKKPSNVLHYIAYTALIAVVLVMAYLMYMPKNNSLAFEKTAAEFSFEDLPYSTQIKYKTVEEFKKIESKLNSSLEEKQNFLDEISSLQEELKTNISVENLEEKAEAKAEKSSQKKSAITESKPKVQMQKEPTIEEGTTASLMESSNITFENTPAKRIKEFTKCYDMDVGKYNITKTCRKNIITFINKHKNALYFEIIGIIDETEFTLFKNLENNNFIYDKLKVTQQSIDTMKKLSQSGLAKHRAIEGNWVIKSHMGKKAQVYNANYNLLSNDGKKGFVIRAYE